MVPNFISLQPDEIAIPASDTQTLTAGAATFSLGVTPPGTRAIVGVQTTDIIATSHAIHEDGQQVPKGRSPIGSGLLIGPAYGDIVPCRIPCGERATLTDALTGGTGTSSITVVVWLAVKAACCA